MTSTRATWSIGDHRWLPGEPPLAPPRVRVIADNDFSGDPDDLYQLVHHLLSPAVDVRLVVASHLAPGDPFDPGPGSAANALARVHELLDVMGLDASDADVEGGNRVVLGADEALLDTTTPRDSQAARAIIAEAMRDDDRPLYYCAGGGLTDVASAYLLEPAIAERMMLVWIGGPEHAGVALPPPGVESPEYNLKIDVNAARVVFNDSTLPLWQVPRDVYRQCLVSDIELRERVLPHGPVGKFLYDALRRVNRFALGHTGGYPETYALGDSPLVLFTALQSHFQPDPSSSTYVLRAAPVVDERGETHLRETGRTIRVYTQVDVRLMFEDMFGKIAAFARWQRAAAQD